ncbi:MAG: prephenate dehydrogenase/arogenate dehydrogenase family protein [Gammaproteobacteria bacterium]|nr:prephenate dehydrogenase/arogenate dehydrogenase family protein [Gammaproteobacteria bacterium]
MINRLAVIGVGLIGGSFALSLKNKGLVGSVIGVGRNEDNLILAKQLNIIDEYSTSLKEAVETADVVFIAVPVSKYDDVFKEIKQHIKHGTIITDGGSTKVNIIEAANREFSESINQFFVPGHPIAGNEKSGAGAAIDSLYVNHKIILTPTKSTDKTALELVTKLWQSIGANVVLMEPVHHDLVLGATSHLPHALAFSLVNMLATLNEREEIFEYAAGGFKDFTRIASSDPKMWQDICLANKDVLLKHIQMYKEELDELSKALKDDHSEYLFNYFSRSKQTRDKFVKT